jgi:hypothetical protein
MNIHLFFVAALLALTAVVEEGTLSPQVDRFVHQLAWSQQLTALPVCNDVELTVVCAPFTDISSDKLAR